MARAILRGIEFDNVGHVFNSLSSGEIGNTSIRELLDPLSLDANPFANGESNLDSVAIDAVAL